MKYIKSSALWHLTRHGEPCDITYVEKGTGMIVEFKGWVCSSMHGGGTTINMRNPSTNEVRKLRRILIIRYNGTKVIF